MHRNNQIDRADMGRSVLRPYMIAIRLDVTIGRRRETRIDNGKCLHL